MPEICDAIAAERTDINSKIGAQDARSDEAAATMKSFEDRKFQKTIKDRYFQFMKQFITEGGECRGAGCRASRVGFGVPSNTVNHAGRRP